MTILVNDQTESRSLGTQNATILNLRFFYRIVFFFSFFRNPAMPGLKNSACTRCCIALGRKLRQDILLVLMMIGVVAGFIIGVFVNESVNKIENPEEKKTTLMLIGFPGELFINMLKMLVLPLIVASLVCALAGIDAKASGRIGRRAVIYYLCTTVVAVILGILVVTIIRPGSQAKPPEQRDITPYRPLDAFLDLLRLVSRSAFSGLS